MPAAEVRPTIVAELTMLIVVRRRRRGAHSVEARGSCCGSWWKEMELCCAACKLDAIRG
jgi:hypothetical protein